MFKILNTFLFLFLNVMLLSRAGIHKMNARKANREDPYQAASSVCLSLFGRQLVFKINVLKF